MCIVAGWYWLIPDAIRARVPLGLGRGSVE
jgi:hypothetical protein